MGRNRRVAVLVGIISAAVLYAQSGSAQTPAGQGSNRSVAQPTPRPATTRVPDGEERPTFDGISVPYPGSVSPAQVLANIQAVARQTHLADHMILPELANGELRVRRLLQVKSDTPPPGFLLAELDDQEGHATVDVAITRNGVILGAQDVRGKSPARAMDLAHVRSISQQRLAKQPLTVEYQYFHNVIEPGYSLFRPIVVVTTERGELFFNSQGQVFAEEGSPYLTQFGVRAGRDVAHLPPRMKRLHQLDRW
jgi:hypothetical protein